MIVAPDQFGTLPKDLVLVGGAFDPIHEGHLAYVRAASAFGAVCCAVATDNYIRTAKGRPPLLSQRSRMAILDAIDPIEYVVAQNGAGEAGVLEDLRPKFYAKGKDWLDRIPEAENRACLQFSIPQLFVEGAGVTRSSGAILRAYQQDLEDRALAQMETIIAYQEPPTQPWQPVTDYSLEARILVEGSQPELIRAVFQPTRVLDVGAGPGHLATLLKALGVDTICVDSNPAYGHLVRDITDPMMRPVPVETDLTICREVLEHLPLKGVRQAVTNLCQLSSRFLYVTTRFHQAPHALLDVATEDDLDPDHRTMLNQTFLRALFVLEGVRRRPDLEQRMDWMHQQRVLVYERVS